MQRVLAVITALTLSAFASALAQKSPPPKGQISASEILDKHITAVGGLEALRSVQTMVVHGRAGLFGLLFGGTLDDFSFYYKRPSDDIFEYDAVSEGESFAGRTEGGEFTRHTGKGPSAINGVTMSAFEECWRALIDWDMAGRYSRIDLVGLSETDGRWSYALRFTPVKGDPFVRYYDSEDFLMVRMDRVQRWRSGKSGPLYAYKVMSFFTAYRDFDGLQLPVQIRTNATNVDMGLLVNDVRTNVPIDDSTFKKD